MYLQGTLGRAMELHAPCDKLFQVYGSAAVRVQQDTQSPGFLQDIKDWLTIKSVGNNNRKQ